MAARARAVPGLQIKEVSNHIPYCNSAQAYLHHRRVLHLVSPRTVAGLLALWSARLAYNGSATRQAHRPCWPTCCSWAPLAAAQDLKPHDILLGRHGEAKIGDVGFSRQGGGSESRWLCHVAACMLLHSMPWRRRQIRLPSLRLCVPQDPAGHAPVGAGHAGHVPLGVARGEPGN